MNDRTGRLANALKRSILIFISVLFMLPLCACQKDFSKPADYTLDVSDGTNMFIPQLSVIEIPGDSQTIVFEIINEGNSETDYKLSVNSFGTLPLVFELDTAQAQVAGASAVGTISGGAKHRYTLTASWPAEKNSYIYKGQKEIVSVTLDVVKPS